MSPVLRATRQATRCPNCKGTLIRRGAGSVHGASTWFYCFFCKHAWKSRQDEAHAYDGELSGAMSVVAKGKKRYPLGSVVVHAIPEDALKKHLKHRAGQCELESEKLEREIDALAATLADAEAEENRLWNIQKQDESNLQAGNAWSVAYSKTKQITRQLEDVRTRQQHVTSADRFFEDLPSAISTATTHADGTFTLAIPRDGRFGIVARASRALEGEERTHLWFVWIGLNGEPAKRLVLNNENVVGAGSPDSALQ